MFNKKYNNTIIFSDNSLFGLLKFRIDVINNLKAKGYKIILVAPNEFDFGNMQIPDGVRYLPIRGAKRASFSIINELIIIFHYLFIYIRFNPKCIFHYTIKPNLYGTLIARLYRIPSISIITGLGHVFQKKSMRNKILRKLYSFSLSYAEKIIVLNKMNYRLIQKTVKNKSKIIFLESGEGINTSFYKNKNLTNHQNDAISDNIKPFSKEQQFNLVN